MPKYSSTLRSWLLAALCSATAFTFSCQHREADTPKPIVERPSGDAMLSQQIADAHRAFDASTYPSSLKDVGPNGKLLYQWQPQWSETFKAAGALFVPLSLDGKKLGNAKRFLVVKDTTFSLALYVFPTEQVVELSKNSPDFLRTFTGKVGWRQLGTKKARFYSFNQGQFVKSAAQGAKPAGGAKTQGCVYNTTCFWEASCSLSGSVVYITTTYGENGNCDEPVVEGLCRFAGQTSWYMYRSESILSCEPESDPTYPGSAGDTQRIIEGWYKINVVSSGLVLDVNGNYTGNGANVSEWSDNGGNNQIWYVSYLGFDNTSGDETYTFTPRSNYLYWQSLGTPPGPSMDQRLGVLPSGAPSNAVGAPVQIWAMSASPVPSTSPSPFNWLLTYAGLANINGRPYNKYVFRNQYSNLYLNVSGGGPFPAGYLLQFPFSGNAGQPNEQFVFTKLPI